MGNALNANQQYNSAMSNVFGNGQQSDWAGGLTSSGQGGGIFGGDMDFSKGMDLFGKGMGIYGGFMQMQNQKKMLEAGITGLNNQTKTGNYNMANNTNFINGTIDAFGSGQAKSQNQFGSMV